MNHHPIPATALRRATGLVLAALAAAALHAQTPAPAVEILDPFVVTATLARAESAQLPLSISVVDADRIQSVGAVTLDQALAELPGLQVEINSGRISRPSIRGTGVAQSLVLLDGRRLAPGFKNMTDIAQLFVGGIERIEIVRGPVSALYGSEAIGGVVNIITRKTPAGAAEATAAVQYGTGKYDDVSGSLAGGFAHGATALYAAYGARHNSEWESGDGAPSDVDEVDLHGGFANLSTRLAPGTELAAGGTYSWARRIGLRPTGGLAERTADDRRFGGHLELKQQLGETLAATLRTYAEQYDNDTVFDLATRAYDSHLRNRLLALDGHLTYTPLDTLDLTVGGELRRDCFEDFADTQPEAEVDNVAAFAQSTWAPVQAVNLVGGLRYDRLGDYGHRTSPQLSALLWATRHWRLHAGAGSGFRAPSSMETAVTTYESGGKTTILPNADLAPERSRTVEAGLQRVGEGWQLGLTAFRTRVDGMISTVTTAKNTKQWRNLTAVEIDGLELTGAVELGRHLSAEAFLCWLDPQDRDTGYHVEGRREWTGMVALSGRLPAHGLRARVALHFGSDEWSTADTRIDVPPTVELRLEKTFARRWSVYVGARNLLDARGDETAEHAEPVHYYTGLTARF